MAKGNGSTVAVIVAHGRTIQRRIARDPKNPKSSDPIKTFMPGERVDVLKSEVDRLFSEGFIKDPYDKKLPSGAEDIDIGAYVNSGDGSMTSTLNRLQLETPGSAST